MSTIGRLAPALFRRAFFVGVLAVTPISGFAATPSAPLPELAQVGKPTPEQAARLVQQFRNSGIAGEYYLEFELQGLPRRGEGPVYKGRWWGSRNDQGAITRIELTGADGASHRFLLQNGDRAKVWRWKDGQAAEIGTAELMAPLVPGLEVSAFDLQMPYLYWPGATVEKITRVLGRPSYVFVFPAPAGFKAQFGGISAARAYFDAQFNVPMQADVIGPAGKTTKTLALLSLQRVGEQTLPKSADYRNEVTRDKSRLQVTGAALNLSLPNSVFEPSSLARAVEPPPPNQVVRIEP